MSTPGSIATICAALTSGPCSTYGGGQWAGTVNASTCTTFFTNTNWATGTTADRATNTIGCRTYYASLVSASDNTTWYNCHFVGFSGGGLCGVPLSNACDAIGSLCGSPPQSNFYSYNVAPTPGGCTTDLAGLNLVWGSKKGVAGSTENSLECRIYHAIAGNTVAPLHCGHVNSTGPTPCTGAVTTNGDQYCGVIMSVCPPTTGGTTGQYNSQAQCLTSFATFPVGPGVSATVNTNNDQSSRQYHVQAASVIGPAHCPHAGPSGGNVVGTTRQAWASLANCAICKANGYGYLGTEVNIAVYNFTTTDLNAIVPVDPNASAFCIAAQNPNLNGQTDTCKLYHLTVGCSSVVNDIHCPHGDLLGGNQCPATGPVGPTCMIIMQACPTAYASATACQTAFGAYFAANKTGNPNTLMPTDDSVACRLYWAIQGLVTRGAGGTVSAAQCANVAIANNAACSTGSKSDATHVAAPLGFTAAVVLSLFW